MNMRLIIVVTFLLLAFLRTPVVFSASLGPISEETPPASCNPGSVVSEVRCTGRYCDNIRISCSNIGVNRVRSAVWTAWVSEEGGGTRGCPNNHYISGFACRGKYCDNLSLFCVEFRSVSAANCSRTRRVSEERGGRLSFFLGDKSGQKFAAKAMKCSGDYCDNKEFEVCELRLN